MYVCIFFAPQGCLVLQKRPLQGPTHHQVYIYIYIFLSKLSILGDGFCCVVHLGYWVCGFLLVCAPSLEKQLFSFSFSFSFFLFSRYLCNVLKSSLLSLNWDNGSSLSWPFDVFEKTKNAQNLKITSCTIFLFYMGLDCVAREFIEKWKKISFC